MFGSTSNLDRFVKAASADAISFVVGLKLGFVPLSLLSLLYDVRKERSALNFTDWKLSNWISIYYKEIENCLKISFKGDSYFLPQVMLLDNTSDAYAMDQIHFHPYDQYFVIPDGVRALTDTLFRELQKKLKEYTNETNLRIVDIHCDGNKVDIYVQPTYYESYLRTNLVLDAKPKNHPDSLRSQLHVDGKLERLKDSPLANLAGINSLIFTADGSIVLQKRSRRVALRRGELSPSGSGTLAFVDVPSERTLVEILHQREVFEEIGISHEDISTTQFLGITRELIRGGEPEMFFFATTRLSESDIREKWKRAPDRWEARRLLCLPVGRQVVYEPIDTEEKHHALYVKTDRLLERYGDIASIPLLTNLALWVKYKLSHREAPGS